MMHIPVVMATDNNYIPLIAVLISLAENAGNDTFYDIYILTDVSFTHSSECCVRGCLKSYEDHCSISFINVGTIFDNAMISIPHITRPTFFRLVIPDLLKEDKCIYLDTDIIVMSDLKVFFNISLDTNYVAGVWHPGVVLFEWENAIRTNANIPDAKQYINAGVLLMNLKQLREDGMVKKFLELIPQNMRSQDQDIINHACFGKITLIPFKYNVITKIADRCIEEYKGSYPEAELIEAWNDPCIVHYAGQAKPWNSSECVFMDYWWKYFRKSSIYESIVNDMFNEFVTNIIYRSQETMIFTKKMPKFFDITFKRKYVVYGAGIKAREVLSYLKQFEIVPEFILVSDSGGNPSEIEGIEVKDICNAGQMLHDKTILIAVREELHKEIINRIQEFDYIELLPISDSMVSAEESFK